MNIAKALTIDGWMSEAELNWLANEACTKNLIVEIGSYKGRSTRALGDNTSGRVIAVDHWNGEDHLTLNTQQRQALYGEFCSNLEDLISSGKVIPIRINSVDVNKNSDLAELRPDMVFIDGDHFHAKTDIEIWLPKLLTGGIICGHDVHFTPINNVVTELVPNFTIIHETAIWAAVNVVTSQ